jgi:CheY-like chemotaxis protein
MPRMDGFQFLDALRARGSLGRIPIILVTAASYSEDLLAQRGSMVAVGRRRAFTAAETARYVRAILDVTEADYPADI